MQDYPTLRATFSASSLYFFLGLSFMVSFIGLFVPIMEVDASQYASMSLELWQSDSFLQLTDLGQDYLDKPPLLFWLSSINIALMGNTSFAYKLPSFLIAWSSVYALYRFTLIYYTPTLAKLSSAIYACSVAFLLFTNDIRTDTLMISFVVIATWQLAEFLKTQKVSQLFLAFAAMAFAMLAKGPIGLLVPLLAVAPHVMLRRQWRLFIRWEVLLLPFVILLILTPMLWGLYEQWGAHGIRFFFWEQSFGRITGENTWENEATYFYFLHNIIWAVLPFTLFFLLGLFQSIKHWKSQKEYISFFGLVLPFLALSMSQYKLPHYIYIVVPFSSILITKAIANWLEEHNNLQNLLLYYAQIIVVAAILTLPILLFMAFPASMLMYATYILGVIAIFLLFYLLQFQKRAFILASFSAFLLAGFILNSHVYPSLLKYQGSSEAAMYISNAEIPRDQVFQQNIWWRAFHYYSGGVVAEFKPENLNKKDAYVLTDQQGYEGMDTLYSLELIKSFPHFNVTRLSINFLNPATRKNKLKTLYLLKIQKKS